MWRKWGCLGIGLSSSILYAGGTALDHFTCTADFVYLQRTNNHNQLLAVDSANSHCDGSCPSNRVLDTKDLTNSYMPGIQAFLSFLPDEKSLYELGSLYLWEMNNTETKHARGDLTIPFKKALPIEDYSHVDSLTANYKSRFYTWELNYWRTLSATRTSYFTLSALFGLRFMNLSDSLFLNVYKGSDHSNYNVTAYNNPLGLQIGMDFQIHPYRRFYWDLLLKAGASLNRINAKVFLGDANNTITLRNLTDQKTQTGMFAVASAGAGFQALDWLKVHVGYQMLYFGGLAVASDQISFSATRNRGSIVLNSFDLDDNGFIMLYGVYAGVILSF